MQTVENGSGLSLEARTLQMDSPRAFGSRKKFPINFDKHRRFSLSGINSSAYGVGLSRSSSIHVGRLAAFSSPTFRPNKNSLFRKQSLDKTDEEETEFLLENQLTLEDQLISDNQLSSENQLSLTPSDQLLVSDLVPPEERNNAKLLLLFLITSIYMVSPLCFLALNFA
ncbi:uncharacterized protein LOC111709824 [Eurytemora carolleeae]|uniref:uncharacterized protein LOC111709824 n=1 Tax=Eurytemora carolleeae TaxID=1294199 RepID=UPI000C76C31B|nr:uncharacterized protein LOC111709824 [Eurytemora carolleeae]|eukprot:XP_023339507.1 uncharacterized protein LOC111709824 [Eurytemora affinis]